MKVPYAYTPVKKTVLIIVTFLISKFVCQSCDTPVFIYAMKNWTPDNYDVAVILNDKPNEYKYVELIKSEINRTYLNASIYVTNNIQFFKTLFAPQIPEIQPPYIAIWFHQQLFQGKPIWHSQLNSTSLKLLFDSPVRREIAQNLIKGDMAVWILLESGIPHNDDEAFTRLVNSLKTIRKDINQIYEKKKIPFVSKEGSVTFSVVRLSPNNHDEKVLTSCLIAMAGDMEQNNLPMAFAIFGRGRALPPLPNEQITTEHIKNICEFLVGDCSCEVKNLNPGQDLLISTDWAQARLPPEQQLDVLLAGLNFDNSTPKSVSTLMQSNITLPSHSSPIPSQTTPSSSITKKREKISTVILTSMVGITFLVIAGIIVVLVKKQHS